MGLLLLSYRENNHKFEANQNTIEVDIIDGCNAKCLCCPRGLRIFPNTMKVMDLELYKKIVDKAYDYGKRVIALFSWGEPFLVQNLSEYCKYAHDKGMYVCLSSNLSMKIKDLEGILKYANHLYVSVSGFTQEVYQITHRGCKIDLVKENVDKLNQLLNDGKIDVDTELRYFGYDYNEFEFHLWEEYLKDSKIKVVLQPGNSNPRINLDLLSKGKKPTQWFGKVCWYGDPYYDEVQNVYCSMVRKFTINANGDMVLCCEKAFDDNLVIGNFLEDDIYEMQEKKLKSKQCDYCFMKREFINILKKSEKDLIKQHKFI